MEPRDQRAITGEMGRLAMQQDEHRLRDIIRQVRIAQPTPRRAINPAGVAPNQLGKRPIAALADAMLFEQLKVTKHYGLRRTITEARDTGQVFSMDSRTRKDRVTLAEGLTIPTAGRWPASARSAADPSCC